MENKVVYIITKNGKAYQKTFSPETLADELKSLTASAVSNLENDKVTTFEVKVQAVTVSFLLDETEKNLESWSERDPHEFKAWAIQQEMKRLREAFTNPKIRRELENLYLDA